MQHDRTVLGWAKKGAHGPSDVTRLAAGETDLLLIDSAQATTARARLKWQVICFEAGVEFVPTAPTHVLAQSDGLSRAIAHESEIAAMLDHIEGMGQLRLGVVDTPVQTAQIPAICGRDWLAHRKELLEAEIAQKQQAEGILDTFDLVEFAIKTHARSTGVQRDILVPKSALNRILTHLRAKAEKIETTMTLSVTGLWPPFSFVQPFCDSRPTWD